MSCSDFFSIHRSILLVLENLLPHLRQALCRSSLLFCTSRSAFQFYSPCTNPSPSKQESDPSSGLHSLAGKARLALFGDVWIKASVPSERLRMTQEDPHFQLLDFVHCIRMALEWSCWEVAHRGTPGCSKLADSPRQLQPA